MNGSPGTPVSFPSTGSFQTVGSIQRSITLNAHTNNTLAFYNPIVGNWAPDFDRIGVNCASTPSTDLRPARFVQLVVGWRQEYHFFSDTRYFSIDGGSNNIVGFNQTPPGDFGDWLSEACPQIHPNVQNAFICHGQSSDISATSPEGINLDVIGYDLIGAPIAAGAARAAVADFNGDGKPDYVLGNPGTGQTAIWYLNNNVYAGGAGPPNSSGRLGVERCGGF